MRMRLARQEDRFVVLGTDATEWAVAAVEFERNLGVRIQLPPAVPAAIREAALLRGIKRGFTKKGESMCMANHRTFERSTRSTSVGFDISWGSGHRSHR